MISFDIKFGIDGFKYHTFDDLEEYLEEKFKKDLQKLNDKLAELLKPAVDFVAEIKSSRTFDNQDINYFNLHIALRNLVALLCSCITRSGVFCLVLTVSNVSGDSTFSNSDTKYFFRFPDNLYPNPSNRSIIKTSFEYLGTIFFVNSTGFWRILTVSPCCNLIVSLWVSSLTAIPFQMSFGVCFVVEFSVLFILSVIFCKILWYLVVACAVMYRLRMSLNVRQYLSTIAKPELKMSVSLKNRIASLKCVLNNELLYSFPLSKTMEPIFMGSISF